MALGKDRGSFLPAPLITIVRCAIVCVMGIVFSVLSATSSQAQSTANTRVYLPLIMTGSTEVSYPVAPDWLTYLNQYRRQANLPPLSENSDWSQGDYNHARYMVKNDIITHTEDSTNPWYTPEGDLAARNSNLMVSTSSDYSYAQAIDSWMQGPFHALGILDPKLQQTGFGIYHESVGRYQTGAGLDILRGRSNSLPVGITFPILWPGNGQTTNLDRYPGNESPDPLTSCKGYSAPTGLPIIIQVEGGSQDLVVSNSLLEFSGAPLEHCRFDGTSYTNPDPASQDLGRNILKSRNAVVLIPRYPLRVGQYTASITINGQTYRWTFSVQPSSNANGLEFQPSQIEAIPDLTPPFP